MNVAVKTDADPWTDINFDDPDLQRLLDEPLKLDSSMLRADEQNAGFDNNVGENWIYPSNMPLRCYQFNITQAALYRNTLVVLPTGLGKTFIAAVVMYNLYRWYPTGKVIFMAPTRPLVAQQIAACQQIMPFPHSDTVELTGKLNKKTRAELWQNKRVFFATPQVVQSDIVSAEEAAIEDPAAAEASFPFSKLKLIVIDEAHKAKGRYAYTEVAQALWRRNRYFRVLALSATPGRNIEDVAEVVRNLFISHIEVRSDTSIDVSPYVHKRKMSTVVVPLSAKIQSVRDELLDIIDPYLRQLIDADVLSGSLTNINRNWLLYEQKRFKERSMQQRHEQQSAVTTNFSICISLYYALELLERHGMRVFLNNFEADEDGRPKFVLAMDRRLRELVNRVKTEVGPNPFDVSANAMTNGVIAEIPADLDFGHPKFEKARACLLEHFQNNAESRAIVFCEYRESVMLIYRLLLQHRPLLKPRCFVGQGGSTGFLRALTQKQQIQIMSDFRMGLSNILIATCIGEEGIDVGEVDLIVCFDINTTNPTRFIQRIGRTGRQKQGAVIMLVTEGKEQALLKDVLANKDQTNKKLARSTVIAGALYKHAPRMVPTEFNPKCLKTYVKPPEKLDLATNVKDTKKHKKSAPATSVKGSQDLRKFFKKVTPKAVQLEEAELDVFELNDSRGKRANTTQPTPGLSTQISMENTKNKVNNFFRELDFSNILPIATQTQTQQVAEQQSPKMVVSALETIENDAQIFESTVKSFQSSTPSTKKPSGTIQNSPQLNKKTLQPNKNSPQPNKNSPQPYKNAARSVKKDMPSVQSSAKRVTKFPVADGATHSAANAFESLNHVFKNFENVESLEVSNEPRANTDEQYRKRLNKFFKKSFFSPNEPPPTAPLTDAEFAEQLKSPDLLRITKQIMLQANLDFVRRVCDQMKVLQALNAEDDNEVANNTISVEEEEIRENYQVLVSILESPKALAKFLEDQELKKFKLICKLDAEDEFRFWEDDDKPFHMKNYDHIFKDVEMGFGYDNSVYFEEEYKKTDYYKDMMMEKAKQNQAQNMVSESMVYDTVQQSLVYDTMQQQGSDDEVLKDADFSMTESKYCSQWDDFAKSDKLMHKSTPLTAQNPLKNAFKRQLQESAIKTCNLLNKIDEHTKATDDVNCLEERDVDLVENSFKANKESTALELDAKHNSESTKVLGNDELTPDELHSTLAALTKLKDSIKAQSELANHSRSTHDNLQPVTTSTKSNVKPELPAVKEEEEEEPIISSNEQIIQTMLSGLYFESDDFLEPFPEEEILVAASVSNSIAKSSKPTSASNLQEKPLAVNSCNVLSNHNKIKTLAKSATLACHSPDLFEHGTAAPSSCISRPQATKLPTIAAKLAATKPTTLAAKLAATKRNNSEQPKLVRTPTKTLLPSPSSEAICKSAERSPSIFDIYFKNKRRLERRHDSSVTATTPAMSTNEPAKTVCDDETLIVPKRNFVSKRKIFDDDSEEEKEKKKQQEHQPSSVFQNAGKDSSSEEIAPTQQQTYAQHRKKRRRLHCSFIEQEAVVSGSEGSADEVDHTIGDYMYDSVVVPNNEAEDNACTSHMQGVYLQSLNSPVNRRGAFKIPAFKVYNDHSKIFSQPATVEPSQYVKDSFVISEDEAYCIDDDEDKEVSLCPLERAELILKERRRAKKRQYAKIATTRKKKKMCHIIEDSSDDDDDDFE